eukprot:gnl/MRDRNA2_/MRDRNA2_76419_c0_seq1.p1 gnl/MRDRNA2_/MRDRNA2_76419_c0~~gnl/MRDRNA2_/MRDRNA2_76419_c0_seq1.p1  ORF type:complete len:641 (-),score=104.03 gnl/MRDRNA2_/MRDRNA2_76419_c0_seq1:296-2218(-)
MASEQDLLECSVCLSTLREPQIIRTCGHTFCRACIQELHPPRCPLCRKEFNMGQICPNYALERVIEQSSQGQGVGVNGHAFNVSRDEPHHAYTISKYEKLGVPAALAELLAAEDSEVALRLYLLDNSGSMAAMDGHMLSSGHARQRNGQLLPQSFGEPRPCSRWEELASMAINHAHWNMELGVPCEFILLNPGSQGERVDGRDVFRVDDKLGDPKVQIQNMAKKLHQARPGGGTPLTESLEYLRQRLHANREGLIEGGRKVILNIATDGVPAGPHDSFVQIIRRIARELPIYIVIRLCTDNTDLHDFYHCVDKELEIHLDIIDDLRGEARNIYRLNPWLTYSPTLQTMRELGTFCKLFDFLDERPLIGPEVALCAQLLLRKAGMPPYPRQPDAFLATVEKELATVPHVYDGHLGRMSPPLNLDALQVVVQPSKHAIPGRMLQAVGLGSLADWIYTGKAPHVWGQACHAASTVQRHDSLRSFGNRSFVAVAPMPGQQMEYHSKTNGRWVECVVSKVDAASGSIMINVKPDTWITVPQQISYMRHVRAAASSECNGPHSRSNSPTSSWRTEDVAQYLEQIELGHLAPKFRENGVDGVVLQELSDEDLITELGCTKLQARKIRRALPTGESRRRPHSRRCSTK